MKSFHCIYCIGNVQSIYISLLVLPSINHLFSSSMFTGIDCHVEARTDHTSWNETVVLSSTCSTIKSFGHEQDQKITKIPKLV